MLHSLKWVGCCVSVCVLAHSVVAQQITRQPLLLDWEASPRTLSTAPSPNAPTQYDHFQGAVYDESQPSLPIYVHKFALAQHSSIEVELQNTQYEQLSHDLSFAENIGTAINVQSSVTYFRGRPSGLISFVPIRRNPASQQLERLVRADLVIRTAPATNSNRPSLQTRNTLISKLNDGNIYKIAINETGIYKLDYNFLQNLGVDVNNINPQNIQVLGNGGEMLPEVNNASRPDDLLENAIFVQGESDGQFNTSDYILFYGKGTKSWAYNSTSGYYTHSQNPYDNSTYYYIKIGSAPGKRIVDATPITSTSYTSTSYDALGHHEEDLVNLLNREQPALPPTGRQWFGEAFQTRRNQSFAFNFNNRIATEAVKITTRAVARAYSVSSFVFATGGNTLFTGNINAASSYVYDNYALQMYRQTSFTTSSNNINIDVTFNNGSTSAEGWLDYISLQARCNLAFGGGVLEFRDAQTLAYPTSTFQLTNASNTIVWDVTDAANVERVAVANSSNVSFGANTSTLREFVAFDGSAFRTPAAIGSVANQNLHSIGTPPSFLIIYHPNFQAEAQQLATHRANFSNMTTLAVNVQEIYNEFSSGSADLTAIRDFVKMLYDRATPTDSLRYLLLFGAGSFDYRGISFSGSNNHNFIPVYETEESLHPLMAYTTDDYFALLDDGEGNVNANQDMDISIGRLPVLNATQAAEVVAKIIAYDTNADHLGDWRNNISFVADDEDNNLHFYSAQRMTAIVHNHDSIYNINKVYIDAYQQVSTGAGNRYPTVNAAILREIFKGTLIMNYVGHGSDDGWAQERIFTNSEINSLSNDKKLPLFITATCSFSPHDDPSINSAGELLLLNPTGGAIALLTTVRVVLAGANEVLLGNTLEYTFAPIQGRMPTLGEILQYAKNASGLISNSNSRKYALLGDPSMTLAYPKLNVATTQFNNQPVQMGLDTMHALDFVTISGEVRDANGNLASSFNGTIYPTVFDKVDTMLTRANDGGSFVRPFDLQQKVIFKGRATVANGLFSFSFVVPRDINYTLGYGKISYYADNGQNLDAHGAYTGIVVGGSSSDLNSDNKAPEVRVFMNDENFASGGTTDANPVLLARLYDENGINTVGNSVGHDLSGELTLPTKSTTGSANKSSYTLNDSYEADINDYQRGTIRYPLSSLSDGRHSITVEAWDTYNNVGHGSTDFVVASSANAALAHVLNYPNPFTTHTNFQFEHNLINQPIDIQIQIFTISGRLLKTINQNRISESYRIADIAWDGLDDYGDKLARGTYIYKVTVRTSEGTSKQTSEYQKLVILR